MRLRDAFRVETFNAMANAIARLPEPLALFVILGSQVVVGVALSLMVTRHARPFEGLVLLGMVILLCLCILALGNQLESAERKLVDAHNILFTVASQQCCCDPNAIIIEAPGAPELIGQPMVGCSACQARALLQAQCPRAVAPPSISVRTGTREEFETHQQAKRQ
jgi:hypothetical protein